MLGPLRPEERKLYDDRRMQHGTRLPADFTPIVKENMLSMS